MKIVEKFTRSKTGREKDNEDCFFTDDNFAVVVDGITSKRVPVEKETNGRFVAQFVCACFPTISAEMSPLEILRELSARLRIALHEHNRKGESAGCSIVVYNAHRRELFSYGDCCYGIDEERFQCRKKSDIRLSQKRSRLIKQALSQGKSIKELQNNDIGREAILDDLSRASRIANCKSEDGYGVLNGEDIIEEYIKIEKTKKGQTIILSSDGYPCLFPTLELTEKNLIKLLNKDPLCIEELLGTKGVLPQNESYDDRTYLRLTT